MADSAVVTAAVLLLALVVDRVVGDPQSPYHPVSMLGRLIGLWGQTSHWPPSWHRAAPLLRDSVELTRLEAGDDSSAYVAILNELGSLLRTLKQLDDSEAEFVKAAAIEAGARGTANPDYATCINNLAGTYRLKGEYAKAESLFEEAIRIYERELGTEHFVYLSALNNLGLVYQDMKEFGKAEELHRKALAVLQKSGKRNTTYATTLNNLASVSMATGRFHEAERYLEDTLELYEDADGTESVLYLTGLNNLAAANYMSGDYAQAERRFSQALAIIGKVLGPDHPDAARTSKNLARTREKLAEAAGEGRQ